MRPDDYRTGIVLFSIKATNANDADEYRLALRATSTNALNAKDIRSSSATIVRKISTTPINVHMGFHMDTTLFDDNTVWDDVNSSGQHILSDAKVDEARLQPNTAYTLYGIIENGGTEVLTLLSFNTDAHPEDSITSNTFLYNFPPDKYTFTIRSGEPFLIDSVFIKSVQSLYVSSSGVLLTQASSSQDIVTPPIADVKHETDNLYAGMYFTIKHDPLGTKVRISTLIKNINSRLNSGKRDTIEYEHKNDILTMNLIAE